MQSQTTFAVLGKGEDGEFEVRVLKQKIWVEGVSYELQVRTASPDCWQLAAGVHGSSAACSAEVLHVCGMLGGMVHRCLQPLSES